MICRIICCLLLIIYIYNNHNNLVYGYINNNYNIKIDNKNTDNNYNNIDNINNKNNNEIQVFLIPHSHCDVGWVETVDQYFNLNVTLILNNIIRELSIDSTKKFNWAEIVYFKRWYTLQNDQTKNQVKNLIKSKQLYFIGGGWAQNDEAVTDYQAVINQMTLGHQFLLDEFGITPEIGWQIDPFGPSSLTPTLFKLMGFKYHVINRIDERIKYVFNAPQMNLHGSGIMTTEKEFEFDWYPSSSNSNLSIFTHVLDHHYSSPFLTQTNYEFPAFSYTTGFDFEAAGSVNPVITDINLNSRALILSEIIQQRSALYRHNNLLLPFGGDFRFQDSKIEFENMDKLIKYFNENPRFGIKIKYATLDEYFNQIFNSTTNQQPISFPKVSSDDYFVYTQCLYSSYISQFKTCTNYWSGFYSAYAELKQIVRRSDALLRTGEMLYSLSSNKIKVENNGNGNENDLLDFNLDKAYGAIAEHRNVSGILTHHDAVTGTSKLFVRTNYMQMLDSVQFETNSNVIPSLVGLLLANKTINLDYSTNNTIIGDNVNEGDIYAVSFTNSLGWDRYEYVEIEIPNSIKIAVYDYDSNPVESQIVQRMDKNGTWYLYTQIKTPALGISTYFMVIIDGSNDNEDIINQDIFNLIEQKPIISKVINSNEIKSNQLSIDSIISIGNSLFNLNFKLNSDNNNLLSLYSYDDLQSNQLSIPLSQNYIEYTSYDDSAYTFRPTAPPRNLVPTDPKYYISNGTLVKIITIIYSRNCSQSYIVYNSNSTLNNTINQEQYFEIDNIVSAGNNKEIASKFTTSSINNNNIFYTSNGLELMKREYKTTFGDDEPWSLISSNFYPTINTVQIVDQSSSNKINQFTILTSQSMGVSSQSNGELELLYVRRSESISATLHEAMNDISNPLIKIKVFFGNSNQIEQIRTPQSLLLENPLLPVYSTINDLSIDKWKLMYNTLYKPFTETLPYNLHLLTFTKQNTTSNSTLQEEENSNYFIRFLNIYELNQSSEYSQPINISINSHFNFLNISNIQETSLSMNSVLNIINNNDIITLNPLELKSFLVTIK